MKRPMQRYVSHMFTSKVIEVINRPSLTSALRIVAGQVRRGLFGKDQAV